MKEAELNRILTATQAQLAQGGQAGTGTWGHGAHARGPEARLTRALSAKVQMRLCRVQGCKSGITTLRVAGGSHGWLVAGFT